MIVYSGISARLLHRGCAGGLSVTQILNVQIYGFFPGRGICLLFFSTLPPAYPRILPIAWSIFCATATDMGREECKNLPNGASSGRKTAFPHPTCCPKTAWRAGLSYTPPPILHAVLHPKPPMLIGIPGQACRMCREFRKKKYGTAAEWHDSAALFVETSEFRQILTGKG